MLEVSPRVPVYPDVVFEANNLYTKGTVFRGEIQVGRISASRLNGDLRSIVYENMEKKHPQQQARSSPSEENAFDVEITALDDGEKS